MQVKGDELRELTEAGRWLAVLLVSLGVCSVVTTPVVRASPGLAGPRVILWEYRYDGENLTITLMNRGDAATDVLLSIRDMEGILVGDPLYRTVRIDGGRTGTSTFRLRGVFPKVSIIFEYDNYRGQETVRLERPAPIASKLSISSPTPLLEARLGQVASYTITLKSEGSGGYFKLLENGLPRSIDAGFFDGGQRILGITLGEGETRNLSLRLSMPRRAPDFKVDEIISFKVFALDRTQAARHENGVPLDNLGAPRLELSLIPRGVPLLSLSLDNRFARVKPGEEIRITATISNPGTVTAADVRASVKNLPYNWSAIFEPERIPSIDPGKEVEIDVVVVLPSDAAPGRYELSISAKSGDLEASEDFEVRVEEEGGVPIAWIFAVIIVLVVVAGIMVKVRRR